MSKVCAILNWLGDNAYEIYKHLHLAAGDDKDDLEKVLEVFENYFKPEQNWFHSWYILGTIYSSHFKCQHDFLMRIREVMKNCSFSNAEEIVHFLLYNVDCMMLHSCDAGYIILLQMYINHTSTILVSSIWQVKAWTLTYGQKLFKMADEPIFSYYMH